MSIQQFEKGFKELDKKSLEDFQSRMLKNPQEIRKIKLEALKELFKQNGFQEVEVNYSDDKSRIYVNYKPADFNEEFPSLRIYSRHWTNPEYQESRISLTDRTTDLTVAIDKLISQINSVNPEVVEKEREKERKRKQETERMGQQDQDDREEQRNREIRIRERERKLKEEEERETERLHGIQEKNEEIPSRMEMLSRFSDRELSQEERLRRLEESFVSEYNRQVEMYNLSSREDYPSQIDLLLSYAHNSSDIKDIIRFALLKPDIGLKYYGSNINSDGNIELLITNGLFELSPELYTILLGEIKRVLPDDKLREIFSKMAYIAIRDSEEYYIPMENYKQFIEFWVSYLGETLTQEYKKFIRETDNDHMNYLRQRLGLSSSVDKEKEYELFYGRNKEQQYALNLLDTEISNELSDLSYRRLAAVKEIFNDGLKEIKLIYRGKEYNLKGEEGFISDLQIEPGFEKLFQLLEKRNQIEGFIGVLEKNRERLQKEQDRLFYGITKEQERREQEIINKRFSELSQQPSQTSMERPITDKKERKKVVVEGPARYSSERTMEDVYKEAQSQTKMEEIRSQLTMEDAYNEALDLSFQSIYQEIEKAKREQKEEDAEGLIELGLVKAMKEEDFKQFDKLVSMTECLDKDIMDSLLSQARQKEDRRFANLLQNPSIVPDVTTRIASGRAFETMASGLRVCGL